MAEVRWRYATAEDVPVFFGGPIPYTLRATVVEVDGVPASLMGLAADGTGAQCCFWEERPAQIPHRRRMAVLRAIKQVMEWVRSSPVPVFTVSDNHELMTKLGFRHEEQDIYLWPT